MRQQLKSFFRKSTLRKKDENDAHVQQSRAEKPLHTSRPNTAPQSTASSVQPSRNRYSAPLRSDVSGHGDSSKPKSRRQSVQQSINHSNQNNATPIATTESREGFPEEIDPEVAENYSAYSGAISPGNTPEKAQHMSTGENSRLTNSEENKNSSTPSIRNGSVGRDIVSSLGSPVAPNTEVTAGNYSTGTGVSTDGGLINGDLPHVKTSNAPLHNKSDRPSRIAEAVILAKQQKRKPVGGNPETEKKNSPPENQSEKESNDSIPHTSENNDRLGALVNGQQGQNGYVGPDLAGVVDLRDTEDTDKTTHYAPAVVHEVVKPTEHEIIEERIFREIHNHDVYHRTLPVYETELLPALHFIQGPNGELKQISEGEIPGWTGDNQRWFIGYKEEPAAMNTVPFLPRQTEPKIIADRTYMTLEGFERRETTILHPPVLDDLSDYAGPVMPIEFTHLEPQGPSMSNMNGTGRGNDASTFPTLDLSHSRSHGNTSGYSRP